MTTHRPRSLGDGARLRRDRSMIADAQRRYNAASADDALKQAATPDPPARSALRRTSPPPDPANVTPLSLQARGLYEGGVVPVREVARLCGVSVAGLYYHIRKHRWRRRRSDVPRDLAKSERQKRRYRELKALRPAAPRGLKARDPDGQAQAFAAVQRATALSGAALSRALARQETEAKARMLSLLTRALRDLRAADGAVQARPTRGKDRGPRRRREWRAAGERPLWADRRE